MTKQEIANQLNNELPNFIGSQTFTRYLFGSLLTEGARYLAETGGYFWLIDTISIHALELGRKGEDFLTCKLTVKGQGAELVIEDGNNHVLVNENITYTDSPLDTVTLWAVRNELNGFTIMLPSEY